MVVDRSCLMLKNVPGTSRPRPAITNYGTRSRTIGARVLRHASWFSLKASRLDGHHRNLAPIVLGLPSPIMAHVRPRTIGARAFTGLKPPLTPNFDSPLSPHSGDASRVAVHADFDMRSSRTIIRVCCGSISWIESTQRRPAEVVDGYENQPSGVRSPVSRNAIVWRSISSLQERHCLAFNLQSLETPLFSQGTSRISII